MYLIYLYFLGILLFFIQKISIFIIFISFLIKYPQQNINQSETRTGDDKLSVELYE